jgi:hypothetical protein
MAHGRAHAAVSSAGGAPRPGWRWVAAVVVACLLAAGCSGGGQQRGRSTATSRPAAVPAQRDYWPTAGWRTAPPAAVGMDPKLVADLDANAAYHPQLRSLLVMVCRQRPGAGLAVVGVVVEFLILWGLP